MENYDVAPLNLSESLGSFVDESDVDGMTINVMGPLAAMKTSGGRHPNPTSSRAFDSEGRPAEEVNVSPWLIFSAV